MLFFSLRGAGIVVAVCADIDDVSGAGMSVNDCFLGGGGGGTSENDCFLGGGGGGLGALVFTSESRAFAKGGRSRKRDGGGVDGGGGRLDVGVADGGLGFTFRSGFALFASGSGCVN